MISSGCQSITSTLSHNLSLARSQQDRYDFAAKALVHAVESVFPHLDDLRLQKGEGHEEYRRAQDSVLELVTFICIPFVRNATAHSAAVSFLEAQAAKCSDSLIRKKLVIYANQLKRSWNEIEPGGIHHAPRAIRRPRRAENGKGIPGAVITVVIAGTLLFAFLRFDLTSLLIPGWNSQPPGDTSVSKSPVKETAEPIAPVPEPAPTAPVQPPVAGYYKYTDEKGVVHLSNETARVPERYRGQLETVSQGNSAVTKVICKGNYVLVPVTLRYRGRETQTVLLLDTGASITTINDSVADRLQIARSDLMAGNSIVADGRRVPTAKFNADIISVGGRSLSGQSVAILSGSGGNGAEGLLGMDFLKEFRYHVDYKGGEIEWGR